MIQLLNGRDHLFQWDLNQRITSNDFKVGDEIHFFNTKQSSALTVFAYELNDKIVADVPNILLQNSLPILVWRYVSNDTSSQTIEKYQIEVEQRAKPANYVYTETEVLNYTSLDERITALENGSGGSGSFIETDPTVPEWAKKPNKPTYIAAEVGAYTKEETKEYVEEYVDAKTETIKSDVEGLQKQLSEEAHFRGYLSTNAKIQALEATPNDFAYSAESGTKWVYDVENGWQDTGVLVPDQLTPASDATPLVNGTAQAGTSTEYARGDHRHPTDTTRASAEELLALKVDINSALDVIIAIQNELIGGDVS